MWTLLAGIVLTNKFVYYIKILFRDDFSNKNIPLFGIVFGWLFQDHIREEFFMTAGKKFMTDWDFRYSFLTQSLLVTKNLIYLAHTITTCELGLILLLFIIDFIILINIIRFFIKQHFKYEDLNKVFKEEIMEKITKLVSKNSGYPIYFIVITFHWVIMGSFLCRYGWFEFFFFTRPFVILIIYSYLLLSMVYLLFLTNLLIINNFSKYIGLILNITVKKSGFYVFLFLAIFLCIIHIINIENFSNGNFLKEIFIKLLFFI